MIIGVDFDNTIVSYDDLFHRLAVQRGIVPADLPSRKNDVRDYLRGRGEEDKWTELQGHVYGPGMAGARPFPGVIEFFTHAIRQRLPIYVISHKTRQPVIGPAYDLHQTARDWLAVQGFFDPQRIGLPRDHVFFGETRQEKIAHIRETGCTVFIDDLEETFLERTFPPGVKQILFGHHVPPPGLAKALTAPDWARVRHHVFPNPI